MLKKSLLILILSALVACAPGLGRTLKVDYIEPTSEEEASANKGSLAEIRVRVGTITDARSQLPIGEIGGRKLNAEGDIALSVTRALQDGLRNMGASLSLYSGATISGEVVNWYVKVDPHFPLSVIDATATVKLHIAKADGSAGYTAQYTGGVQQKHPFASESRIEKALGDAMVVAFKEALNDESLVMELVAQGR